MARWKALPEGLDPAVVQLIAQLRRMKDDSGLSLDRLAARTGYSASSWERYLGGRLLPPLEAAEALADLTGADRVRLQVLHEAAAEVWQSRPGDSDEPGLDSGAAGAAGDEDEEGEDRDGTDGSDGSRPRFQSPDDGLRSRLVPDLRTLVTAGLSALLGAAIALLATQPWHTTRITTVSSHPLPVVVPARVKYVCDFTTRDGKLYAGISSTNTDNVVVDNSGVDVAELQCLLQHAGISPGGIDGAFGPLTELAVIKEQQAQHLSVDGQVGPKTWAALRG